MSRTTRALKGQKTLLNKHRQHTKRSVHPFRLCHSNFCCNLLCKSIFCREDSSAISAYHP